MTKHFLTLHDLGGAGIVDVLDRADELARLRGKPGHPRPLAGKSVAVLLEKSSTRTRVSFEVGIHELGGHPLTLLARDLQIGRGESIEDTAELFSRYVHAVVFRTFGHDRVETLAKHASVPVVNGLTDEHHPLQILADLQTARRHVPKPVSELRVAWVGDGNNVSHSWIEAAGLLGFTLTLACPDTHRPSAAIVARANEEHHGAVRVVKSPDEAIEGADVVTTDVWASMGQEHEAAARKAVFEGYAVTTARMAHAAKQAIFLHCLPAHRGEEVDAAVLDGPQSRIFDEAENRLHTQKALLERLVP